MKFFIALFFPENPFKNDNSCWEARKAEEETKVSSKWRHQVFKIVDKSLKTFLNQQRAVSDG